MSFPCLNPFMVHCPNTPFKESAPSSPPTLLTLTLHSTLHSCQSACNSPNTSCSLSPEPGHMLFPLSGMFSSTFYLANPNSVSEFRVDMTASRKPLLPCKTRFCALRSLCTQTSSNLYPTLIDLGSLSVSPIQFSSVQSLSRVQLFATP